MTFSVVLIILDSRNSFLSQNSSYLKVPKIGTSITLVTLEAITYFPLLFGFESSLTTINS